MHRFIEKLEELTNLRESFVVVTLINTIGSAPQDIGAKAIVTKDGLSFGTVGGGKIEAHAIRYSVEFLSSNEKKIELKKWNLQTEIGMTCGGVVELLFEKYSFENQFKVAIFGAGHVAIETVNLLSKLNCFVLNVETRKEWQDKIINKENVKKVLTTDMSSVIDEVDENYFIVSLTMGHAFDRPILKKALSKNFKFVGVIGSSQKANVLKKELMEDGLSLDQIQKMHCPVGLPIGGNDPAEIAISIVAQMLMIRDVV